MPVQSGGKVPVNLFPDKLLRKQMRGHSLGQAVAEF